MQPASGHDLLNALVDAQDEETQRRLIDDGPLPSLDIVTELSARIRECLPRDPRQGERLANACVLLAERLQAPVAWAYANRGRAYVHTTLKKCAEADPFYERAARLFRESGSHRELGRTLIAQAENLTYLSEYSRAQELALEAHALFRSHGGGDDIAKVHIFAGNLFNRLNRYSDALAEYERARDALRSSEDYMNVAAVEMNRSSVLVELNRFSEAIEGLERAREYCDRHSIAVWGDILDRNIARLYFSLGRYSDALRSLNRPRPRYRETGDARRLALCDQACASVYLQLNMFREAEELAERALETFTRYSNRFEAAESLGLVGIARSERGDPRARESFLRALEMFREEGNDVSVAATRLQLGRLSQREGRHGEARDLARQAARAFEAAGLAVRCAYARLVVAQSLHAEARDREALVEAREALASLNGYHAPWVSYQCRDLLGTLSARQGGFPDAERLYREAIDDIESLRGSLELDEFRTSFGKDKYHVYENLVALLVDSGQPEAAFRVVERARSRTLIDLLEQSADSVWTAPRDGNRQALDTLRQELNGLYSRLSRQGTTVGRLGSDGPLRESIRKREEEMLRLLREAGTERTGWVALEGSPAPTVTEVQQMLSEGETLIEYYVLGGRYCAFVMDRTGFSFGKDLGALEDVRRSLRGLNFQLSKFHLSPDYLAQRQGLLLSGVRFHLRELYELLVAPLEAWIRHPSLVIVPHGLAHYVPFQALYDGERHLIDRFDFSSGASASVLRICRQRPRREGQRDLILAVPDEGAPAIREEAEALRKLLPRARVFIGESAGAAALAEHGGSAGKLHIAAHGIFRSDNPVFSALKLSDTWLNLVDIFNLRLGSELTTLSACETGMSAVYDGDELLGLTQGFLYAGTPSLVVSLWRVNDRSTTMLMTRFYAELLAGRTKPQALRLAALEVREAYPHPYYWAPFMLMGQP